MPDGDAEILRRLAWVRQTITEMMHTTECALFELATEVSCIERLIGQAGGQGYSHVPTVFLEAADRDRKRPRDGSDPRLSTGSPGAERPSGDDAGRSVRQKKRTPTHFTFDCEALRPETTAMRIEIPGHRAPNAPRAPRAPNARRRVHPNLQPRSSDRYG